jgi:hypothetical protein
MAKASIALPNGTQVQIDGTAEEIAKLMTLYAGAAAQPTPGVGTGIQAPVLPKKKPKRAKRQTTGQQGTATAASGGLTPADIAEIVNTTKTCPDAEAIETHILDKTSTVDRTLLPLFVVHEYLHAKHALTSGDINRITTQLGVPVSTPNASTALSGSASRYVMADGVRRRGGAPVRYTISRRGTQYMKAIVSGKTQEASGGEN